MSTNETDSQFSALGEALTAWSTSSSLVPMVQLRLPLWSLKDLPSLPQGVRLVPHPGRDSGDLFLFFLSWESGRSFLFRLLRALWGERMAQQVGEEILSFRGLRGDTPSVSILEEIRVTQEKNFLQLLRSHLDHHPNEVRVIRENMEGGLEAWICDIVSLWDRELRNAPTVAAMLHRTGRYLMRNDPEMLVYSDASLSTLSSPLDVEEDGWVWRKTLAPHRSGYTCHPAYSVRELRENPDPFFHAQMRMLLGCNAVQTVVERPSTLHSFLAFAWERNSFAAVRDSLRYRAFESYASSVRAGIEVVFDLYSFEIESSFLTPLFLHQTSGQNSFVLAAESALYAP